MNYNKRIKAKSTWKESQEMAPLTSAGRQALKKPDKLHKYNVLIFNKKPTY